MTLGGSAFKSITWTNDSGSHLVGSCESILIESAISARRRSGVMATLDGGPMTEFGTLATCWTEGGNVAKFRSVMESGAWVPISLGAPEVRAILFSLPERMSCAPARLAQSATNTTTTKSRGRFISDGNMARE